MLLPNLRRLRRITLLSARQGTARLFLPCRAARHHHLRGRLELRAVAGDLAGLGYVVAAPDLFWRLQPGYQAAHDEAGLASSLEMGSRFDVTQGVADSIAALGVLAGLPEVDGGIGIIGFCLGGSIAYLAAAQTPLDAVISFYGSAVPEQLGVLGQITAPLLLHFGGSDPYIPREQVQAVQDAAAGQPNVLIYVEEEAGHAFHNRKAPMFSQPEPAARAWRRTEEFLRRHLPARTPVNGRPPPGGRPRDRSARVSGRAGENTHSTWVRPAGAARAEGVLGAGREVKASPCSSVTCSPAREICSCPARTKTNSTSAGSA